MASHINADSDRDVRRVMDSIRRIVQGLRMYNRQADRRVGLSGAQLFVLQKLRDGTGISVNELARRTHTHQSSVSVVAQKLVDQKLVRRSRSKADGRAVELALTTRGRNLLRRAPAAAAQDQLVVRLQQLPVRKRRQLRVLLEELAGQTGDGDRPPALFFEDVPKPQRKEGP
jgi:DNA-binding MarR family transcriptional regulator